jgi:N-succinyldiaminopimelate aminotransferase
VPRFPQYSPAVAGIPGSVYSSLAHRLATFEGETYPLHVGDTWLEPPDGCRMEDLRTADYPGLHRYAPPHGLPALVEAVAEQVAARTGVPTTPNEVLMATGATGALGAVAGALLAPGDEVLILAPYWPLIAGIVRSFHATPVPVPYLGAVSDAVGAVEAVTAHRTPATVALYLNTPNNPTGRVIPRDQVEALADWGRAEGLWLIADEVYEDYCYRGEHVYLRALAPERTFAAYSFSKAYGMAGNRIGYAVGPAEAMDQVRKVSTHTFYSAPTAGQVAALRLLEGRGEPWLSTTRERYRELGAAAARRLGLPAPEGSTFLFLDVADRLDERGLLGFLEDCVERGLFLAPGPSFGPYPTSVRLCFTSAEPEVVARGVEVLAGMLGRFPPQEVTV